MEKIDLYEYLDFSNSVTSDSSKKLSEMVSHLEKLEKTNNVNMARLLTASEGLSGESGEFSDIVKKLTFHYKEFDEETKQELKKELGDCLWYWSQGVMALGLDPYEVLNGNIEKLSKRYPGGFSAWRSENREE